MKKPLLFLLLLSMALSCHQDNQSVTQVPAKKTAYQEIIAEDHELYTPTDQVNAVLILFGGYPEKAEDIKREFQILDIAKENNIAVLLSNFNQKLWLEEQEKHALAKRLQQILVVHQVPTDNIYMGGFSSGGVISLLLSDFIAGRAQYHIAPKGVFIVDSPIDLVALYETSEKNVEREFSEVSVQESSWLLDFLGGHLGDPKDDIENYERMSVFTWRTGNTTNLENLKETKIRLYTEPDTLWWKSNRMNEYEETNAFYIKELAENLTNKGFRSVEYIPTSDKGYRANGERHPHSWAIVDKADLMNWMLGK
jgi:hypothetical protein